MKELRHTAEQDIFTELRSPCCHLTLAFDNCNPAEIWDYVLKCECGERYPVFRSIPRMLLEPMRNPLLQTTGRPLNIEVATAQSFGFEWTHFPEMYSHWEQNFLDYITPRTRDFFVNKRVLDAGCGNGRHAYYAALYGADVWAIDLGDAVEVARKNTESVGVHVVQADLHHLPFLSESFDFVYSFGVLHHLPDPERAFRKLLDFLKPGGEIQIYVYWKPETGFVKRFLLGVLSSVRQLTSRLPYRVVWLMSYPIAGIAFICGVFPYRLLRCLPRCRSFAERIPLRQYAKYPFRVCVNDQFDRLSAPIEQRYTRDAVKGWFERAGLRDIVSCENFGWTVAGRKPPGDVCSKSRSFEQNGCALNRR